MKNCSFQNSVSKILWYFFIIPSKLHWIDLTYIILWPKIFMTHIWTIFNKINIYAKKVINKGQISKISSLTHYHFSLKKITGSKIDFLLRFIMGNVYNFSRFGSHSQYLLQFLNVIGFTAIQNPRRHHIF